MKIFLQIGLIIIFCMSSAGAQTQKAGKKEKPFTFDCSTCHACDTPTRTDPCLKACPRTDLITVHHSPEEGPDVIELDNLNEATDLYEPVTFSHRTHSEMSGMAGGCMLCHHYNPPGAVAACRDCHSMERMRRTISLPDLKAAFHRQCIDCHRTWSTNVTCDNCHFNRGISTADREKSKQRIHPPISEPTRLVYETGCEEGALVTFFHNDHTSLYGFSCNDCHTNESCARCHHTEESAQIRLAAHDVHSNCENCHDTDDKCAFCHHQEIRSPFSHARRSGFALSPYHHTLDCRRCHTHVRIYTGLKGNCTTCHSDWSPETFDHSVTGIILDENHIENDCEYCHIDNQFSEIPSCESCHGEDVSYPGDMPGRSLYSEKSR